MHGNNGKILDYGTRTGLSGYKPPEAEPDRRPDWADRGQRGAGESSVGQPCARLTVRLRSNYVFVNRPLDPGYGPMFDAIVFGVYHLGFVARCAREEDDAGEVRLSRIERIIEECRFGINDLSTISPRSR